MNRKMLFAEIKTCACQCGGEHCNTQLTIGSFDQGTGFSKDVAERFVKLWNNARDVITKRLRPQAELENELMDLRISIVRLAQHVGADMSDLGITDDISYAALCEKARYQERGWNKLVAQIMSDLEGKGLSL